MSDGETRIGVYVLALTKIMSAPPPDVKSGADRYAWCVGIAEEALRKAPPERLRTGSGVINGKRVPYVSCLECGWLTYGGGSADHTDDCIHSPRRNGVRDLLADRVDIPGLGVTLSKKVQE